jgi:hypothetical protein
MLDKFKHTTDRQHRKNQLIKFRIEQEVICRELDKNQCQNPKCNKQACFSWQIDCHHINGRSPEFLSVPYLICLCRIDHELVELDSLEMIRILNSHIGQPYFRWQKALTILENKYLHKSF